jgi:hypothetical protein
VVAGGHGRSRQNPLNGERPIIQCRYLGLANDWAYRIIKAVGNYGESFERNVGMGSPIKIRRGLNALWNKGGLQYAPPIR